MKRQRAPELGAALKGFNGGARVPGSWRDFWGLGRTLLAVSLALAGDHGAAAQGAGACDTWRPITKLNAPEPVERHTAVWTGKEMIVWGGWRTVGADNRGNRYDPVADVWKPMAADGAPAPRIQHAAFWTGNEMLVWGGHGASGTDSNDGGRYDPAADRWRPVSIVGAPSARTSFSAAWTGRELVIWGGFGLAQGQSFHGPLGDGAAYDPATDLWRPLNRQGAPSPRLGVQVAWTGTEMIIWGGSGGQEDPRLPRRTLYDGALYNPSTDTWRPMSPGGAPGPPGAPYSVWTGRELLVVLTQRNPSGFPLPNQTPLQDVVGARYDPAGDAWTPLAAGFIPLIGFDSHALWSRSEMIVINPGWGNFRYNPDRGTWAPLPLEGAPTRPRIRGSAVWTGSEVIIWGGTGSRGMLNDGARYIPPRPPTPEERATITAAYRHALARDPDPTGLETWTCKALPWPELLAALESSAEGLRVTAVRGIYIDLLGRDPLGGDNAGLRGWVDSELSLEEIRAGVAASPEAQARAG